MTKERRMKCVGSVCVTTGRQKKYGTVEKVKKCDYCEKAGRN
jgi:aspartate carbamoyltransferase regulatory subunit